MCDTCGCGDSGIVPLEVQERILQDNEATAHHNRDGFVKKGTLAVNVMGSPGSGKTALLERTAQALSDKLRLGALAGDLETENDADRLRGAGLPSWPITTGSACHLDAALVHKALHDAPMADLDYLFIENVGNLVCPAVYDLGQAVNAVVLSVTEGEDKPLKYPVMFRKADVVLLSKIDLLPHLPQVRVAVIEEALGRVMPEPVLLPLSSSTGEGIGSWLEWLEERRRQLRNVGDGPSPG